MGFYRQVPVAGEPAVDLDLSVCPHGTHAACPAVCLLSGHSVGRLSVGRQFLLWALRRRHGDGQSSDLLAQGFRLAVAEADLRAALDRFDELYDRLRAGSTAPPSFCCLRCGLVSADEWLFLELVIGAADAHSTGSRSTARPLGDLAATLAADRFTAAIGSAGRALLATPGPQCTPVTCH